MDDLIDGEKLAALLARWRYTQRRAEEGRAEDGGRNEDLWKENDAARQRFNACVDEAMARRYEPGEMPAELR